MDVDSLFEAFSSASQVSDILQLFSKICDALEIDQADSVNIYSRLRNRLKGWKAEKLWSYLDKRAALKEYCFQTACRKLAVLVVGAGPCGLRAAIECLFLGAFVVLVEQREDFYRNNVLHIWPFVIQDLKDIGIKVFYPKFCRGSIDHISIRQLQYALLKIALVLGLQFFCGVTFKGLIFPKSTESCVVGWRASLDPASHILSNYVFDALIGADGKKSVVPGFSKTEMRGKLAIGVAANFVNRGTVDEEKVEEISGVSYIFNQKFFKQMKDATNIDLENIVYYKDETHYFVMCVKKQSLLDKGVLINDYDEISLLLSQENINQDKLSCFALTAANFATKGKLPNLTFEKVCCGRDDVAVFDFTSFYSAKWSVRVVERCDMRLLISIVGDSLLEPFWPSGSGCARGFLGVFDVAWMLRNYGLGRQNVLRIIAERESIYKLLAQAKPDNLQKKLDQYTIDPRSRYVNLNFTLQPIDVCHLVDTDNPRDINVNEVLPLRTENNDLLDPTFFKRYGLLRTCQQAVESLNLKVYNFSDCWRDGRVLARLILKYRPDLVGISFSNNTDVNFELICSTINNVLNMKCNFNSLSTWNELCVDERVQFLECLLRNLKMYKIPLKEESVENVSSSMIDLPEQKLLKRSYTTVESFDPFEEENKLIRDFLAECNEELREKQVNELLNHFDELLEHNNSKHDDKEFDLFFEEVSRKEYYEEHEEKHFTKRPVVDKLDSERLNAVEKIITGKIEAEKTRELYSRKQKEARLSARKMDQRDIQELEEKLEKTAMGLSSEKKQFRSFSTKEEKIMVANAAAARELFKTGFKSKDEKYKDLDDRIFKAELLLKSNDLAGVNAVTKMRQQNCEMFTTKRFSIPLSKCVSKPAPPPKKVTLSRSVSSRCSREKSLSGGICNKFCNPREVCKICQKRVYFAESVQVEGLSLHRRCFVCAFCHRPLRIGNCGQDRDLDTYNPRFFCIQHLNLPLHEKIKRIEEFEQKLEDASFPSLLKSDALDPSTILSEKVVNVALNNVQKAEISKKSDSRDCPQTVSVPVIQNANDSGEESCSALHSRQVYTVI
uniref:LIM zinc-binding domain-containing protein n=1 Tax=Syphacia muris TaxID=451379 RepID=A0A158R5P7_9BILA